MKTIIILSVILVLIIIAVISFLKLNPVFGGKPDKATMSRILASDNFQDGVFKNLENTTVMAKDQGSMVSTMLEWIRGVEDGKPDIVETQKFNKQRFLNDTTGNFKATWLGHSSILLRLSNKTLLIDPVLSNYASPIPATNKSFKFSEPFTISDLPEIIDILLISHDHYDHLDMPTIKKINQSVKKYLVPLGVKSHLVRWGVEDQKIVELDWWDEESIDGILFACTPARHFSGRSFKRNTTLWCSWVIKDNTSSVYFGADSGYGKHFRTIGDKYGPFDLTFLECGQYNNKWPEIHAAPEESVQANIDLKGKNMIAIHWSKFQLALHPWKEPMERAKIAAGKNKVSLLEPVIGEVLLLN